uniref:SET domain-containing protein-lysine N-methyltransferase n=1 Tax=Flavobacterium sp. TaxID=239 RepID=UPI0037536E55
KINASESDYLYTNPSQITNSGTGLYTAITIYKDEIIAIYKGKILTESEAKTKADKGKDKYFINLLDGTILDSMSIKCFAKYANDATGFSKSDFKNNSKIGLDENENVCLIATRKIKQGEEVFCNYGKRYWNKHK